MKVIFLTNHLEVGGITSYVLSLTKGLKKNGHDIFIASSPGGIQDRVVREGAFFISVPMRTKKELSPRIIFSLFKIAKVIKENKIQLVHSNTRTTQVLGCLIGAFLKIPHVYTCHGFFKRRLIRRIFPCFGDRVIAISNPVKEHLLYDFGLKENKVSLVYNGLDFNEIEEQSGRLKEDAKRRIGITNSPLIGIIARLSDVKGHVFLIEAMRKVCDKIPQAALLIAGEGKIKQELLKLTKELDLERNVFFLKTEDTQGILHALDIFVLPSLKEGLGLALMEAMAVGLPVIGSDIGGIKSLIKDGFNGLLVKPGDSFSIAGAILYLLSDKEKMSVFGSNARQSILDNFSLEKMVLGTEEVYAKCLKEKQ